MNVAAMKSAGKSFTKDLQYYKFCAYGFLKNLRFFEPFLLLFLLSEGLSYFQAGALFGFREIIRHLLEIPSGMAADAAGRKRSLILAFGLYIISFMLFYFTGSIGLFFTAMFFYAAGDAFRSGTHKAMIFDYLEQQGLKGQKVKYYGHTRSWSQTGSAISSLLAGAVVFITGEYRTIFLFTTLPYLIDLVLVLSYPASLNGPVSTWQVSELKKTTREVLISFWNTFRRMEYLRLLTAVSLFTGYYKATRDYLQVLVQTMALALPVMAFAGAEQSTSVWIGVIYFLIYLIAAVSARNAGRVSELAGSPVKALNVLLPVGLAAGALSGIAYYFEWFLPSVLMLLLIFPVENLRKPAGVALLGEMSDRKVVASVLSVESQFHSLLAALIAPVLGYIADVWGVGAALTGTSLALLVLSPWVRLKDTKS